VESDFGRPERVDDACLAAPDLHANAMVVILDRKFIPLGNISIKRINQAKESHT
jgi:hypothetical protein